MKIKIDEAKELALKVLEKSGFPEEERKLITENVMAAELAGRKSHGFNLLLSLTKMINVDHASMTVKVGGEEMQVIKETNNSLYIDAKLKPGFYVIYKSLETAIPKAKKAGIYTVGIKNAGYSTGYIGDYARKAAENDLIYIGFHSIYGDLVPFGAKKAIFGTNPITIGVPSESNPVILDMASSVATIGSVVIARNEGKKMKEGIGVDAEGKPTTEPMAVLNHGGVLPIAGHKGSGLAFMVELLGGALTASAIGFIKPGAWGSFYILVNPEMFRPVAEFKADVSLAIRELKNAPKAEGFAEIFFPGERSAWVRQNNLQAGEIEIDEKLWKILEEKAKRNQGD
jgi:L-2-hydroxycarboxylate dehydrogenase (NAD+)